MRQRHWRRRVFALTILPFAIASGIVGVCPIGSAHPGCFQKGGYNPPPCTTSAPVADDGQTPSNQPGDNQGPAGSSSTGQSSVNQGSDPPPDSGLTACQNQSAMSTSLGLQPVTCRATQGANTPPDSGVTACQNQNAMSTSLGLQPAVCPPTKGG